MTTSIKRVMVSGLMAFGLAAGATVVGATAASAAPGDPRPYWDYDTPGMVVSGVLDSDGNDVPLSCTPV